MSYGAYILNTGRGLIGEFELILGEYYYSKDFAGRRPVMDLGPGRCWFTKQAPNDIVAVDIEPEIVAHYQAEGLQIVQGSAYEIPFPDGYFDGVFSCWLFEHIPDVDRAMQELFRVLRPGGKCLIIVPSARYAEAFWNDYTHVRPFTRLSLQQLAAFNGFTGIETQEMPYTRGVMHLIKRFGREFAARWLRFADRRLRRVGLSNAGNLELRCIRPQVPTDAERGARVTKRPAGEPAPLGA